MILSTVRDAFTADVIRRKKKLQVISNYGVGLDNIGLTTAQRSSVTVYNTLDVVTESTADMTFALLLSLIRKIDDDSRFFIGDKWSGWDPEIFLGVELLGKTFGIIGLGRVGKAVAKKATGFGLKIISCDGQSGLTTLLAKSDYVSIHAPLKSDTTYMINK